MISDALAGILRSGRAEFNRQFAEARRLRPDLDAAAFQEFMRTTVDEIAGMIESSASSSLSSVITAAYEIGLELVGQKLAGPGARTSVIEQGWKRLAPQIAPLIAAAPARILGSISNALHNLSSTPGARPMEWLDTMVRLGPKLLSVGESPTSGPGGASIPASREIESFLRLGQLAAWKAGMAHFRKGAIAAADELPEDIVLAALGARQGSDWATIRKGLLASPWFDPESDGEAAKNGEPVFAGAFRGYGGLFIDPPRVAAAGDDFLVRSGDESWLLTADRYGATFHRATISEFEAASCARREEAKVEQGIAVWKNRKIEVPEMGNPTSVAANETTVALTSGLTHAVMLIPVAE